MEPPVVQLILELLVIGVPPAAIPSTIGTMYESLYGVPPDDLPSVSYIRRQRTVVQVIGETVAAIKLGNAVSWDQIFYDETTRRQIPFQAMVVGLMGADFELDEFILSSCIFMRDSTSETTSDALFKKVCLHVSFVLMLSIVY